MKKIFYALLILIAIAAGGVYWLVASGEYKPYLEQQIEKITGRQVKVTGEVQLSFYPWLGLVANDVSVSNTKVFGKGEFARIKQLKLKAQLLPLLKTQIKADKILLDGLNLNLLTNKKNQNNWQGGDDQSNSEFDFSKLKNFSFAQFKIVDANIQHYDEKTKATSKIDNLNAVLGKFRLGQDLPVKINFALTESGAKNRISAAFDLATNFDANKFTVRKLNMSLKDLGLSLIANNDLTIDHKLETVRSKGFKLSGKGFAGNMSLAVSKAFSSPVVNGSLSQFNINLRQILSANEIKLQTANKTALQSFKGKMNFSFAAGKASLSKIVAILDKTNLAGSAVINVKSGAASFNLLADSINLDDYLSPTSGKDSQVLPVNDLRALNLKGKIKFNKNVKFSGLNLAKPKISLNVNKGILAIKPISAGVFGGTYAGGGVINVKGKTPSFKFNENLKNIDAKRLLEFLIGKNYVGGNVWLEGRANAAANVTLYGNTTNALIRSLGGTMNLSLNKGVVKGIDLMHELTKVHRLANKKPIPQASGAKQTKINKFVVNSTAKKGVIYSNKVLVLTNIFKVTGKGNANLVTENLNYNLVLEVLNTKAVKNTAVRDLIGYKIPFTLRGSFAAPKVMIDSGALLKALAKKELDKEKAKLKKRAAEEKAKLKKRLDKKKAEEKAKVKEKLKKEKDKLKDRLKKEKDKLKDKLKDTLRGLF